MSLPQPPSIATPAQEPETGTFHAPGRPLNSLYVRWFSALYNLLKPGKSGTFNPATVTSITVKNGIITDWH